MTVQLRSLALKNVELGIEFVTQCQLLKNDGKPLVAGIRLKSIPGQEGGTVLTITDLSEQTYAEQQKVLLAASEERTRLAYQIHDGVGQLFAGILVNMRGMLNLLQQGKIAPSSLNAMLTDTLRVAKSGILECRRSQFSLTDGDLSDISAINLYQTIVRYAERMARETQTEVHSAFPDEPILLDNRKAYEVVRIAIEAIYNALRHADALNLVVSLDSDDKIVSLLVSDDGCGFELNKQSQSSGLGLKSIAIRAASIGGRLIIDSYPGRGTEVIVEFPIDN